MSLARTIRSVRQSGLKKYIRDMWYIGDAKTGTLVGTDSLGNKYYENLNEQPGRHRWVDYASPDYNTVQVEPVWHSWLNHIRQDPPNRDPIVEASRRNWEMTNAVRAAMRVFDLVSASPACPHAQEQHTDSVTGTRASFRTYNTTRPKINVWEPTVAARK